MYRDTEQQDAENTVTLRVPEHYVAQAEALVRENSRWSEFNRTPADMAARGCPDTEEVLLTAIERGLGLMRDLSNRYHRMHSDLGQGAF